VQARAVDKVILHVAVAANTVGLGVILALLAELQDAYDLPTSGLGLIAGASFVTSFFAYLGLSRFADRGHAKAMLMAGSLVGSAALVLTAFAQDLWLLVFARAMLGLAEGVFVPAARRVVLDWDPDRPGEVLGTIMAASVGGFLLGPVIGGLLAPRFGLEVPFLLPAVIMMAAVPVIARLRAPVPIPAEGESSFMGLLRNRLVVAGILFMCVDFLTFGVFDSMWSRLLTDAGATTEFIGLTFALVAVPMLLLTRVLGRLVDRRSPMSVAIAAGRCGPAAGDRRRSGCSCRVRAGRRWQPSRQDRPGPGLDGGLGVRHRRCSRPPLRSDLRRVGPRNVVRWHGRDRRTRRRGGVVGRSEWYSEGCSRVT